MDPQFKKFKLDGQLYLWKYRTNTRNHPGWNISCNETACISIYELLSLMDASKFSSEVTIPVNAPTHNHLRVVNNGSAIKTIDSLTLKYKKSKDAIWHIQNLENHLQFTFDQTYLVKLKDCIARMKRSEGDFGICDIEESEESILNFWWHPKV